MILKNNVRVLLAKAGYKDLLNFAEDHEISYYLLRKLANNESNSIPVDFLVKLASALKCQIGDLLYVDQAS